MSGAPDRALWSGGRTGRRTRFLTAAAILAFAPTARAQQLTPTDSALVGRVLLAEDRRDSSDASLGEGAAHADPRIRALAQRALGRIRDPKFAARSDFTKSAFPPHWPEPAWRIRYRALQAQRDDCAAMRTALGDESWPVRIRAMALLGAPCAADASVIRTLVEWTDALPSGTARRTRGSASWHAGAHALVALARLAPDSARARLARAASHPVPNVRQYAARAAATLSDTATLRRLATDRDDNVKEAAIERLSRLVGHGADDLYVEGLRAMGAQAVRAAAIALKGTANPAVPRTARATLARLEGRGNQSEADARVALLDLLGRPVSEDRAPTPRAELPRDAVALALGKSVTLRVEMDQRAGGGSFDVRLRGDVAPIMAARILALAERGYYDGLTWHRVEHDFVIQGGSPGANEYVGLRDYLRDELGTLPHARGTLGMSTRGHDTGDAQWFVNLRDNPRLNADYTVWGEILAGIDVVDDVMEGDRIRRIRVAR